MFLISFSTRKKANSCSLLKLLLILFELVKNVSSFPEKNIPINYLGCPLYIGRQRIIYYSNLVAKIVRGSMVGILNSRALLVKLPWLNMFYNLFMSTLFLLSPLLRLLSSISKMWLLISFGGRIKIEKNYHCASWETFSFPQDEGGIGVRNLVDVCTAFQHKQ